MFKSLLCVVGVLFSAVAGAQLSQPLPSFPSLGVSLYEKPKQTPSVSVARVEENTPAAEAGLAQGDLVLRVGERPIARIVDVIAALRQVAPGASVDIVVQRGAQEQTLSVTPAQTL